MIDEGGPETAEVAMKKRLHLANHILGGGVLFTELRLNYRFRLTMLVASARAHVGRPINSFACELGMKLWIFNLPGI